MRSGAGVQNRRAEPAMLCHCHAPLLCACHPRSQAARPPPPAPAPWRSTSPYSDKGPTWQQAVQWMPEVAVAPGQELELAARHDTYSISYALPPGLQAQCDAAAASAGAARQAAAPPAGDGPGPAAAGGAAGPQPTGVPLVDPAWRAAFDRLQGLNGQLVKGCVQNPLEYRAVAQAALQLAARPHDLGVDAQQAADFCVKMMG